MEVKKGVCGTWRPLHHNSSGVALACKWGSLCCKTHGDLSEAGTPGMGHNISARGQQGLLAREAGGLGGGGHLRQESKGGLRLQGPEKAHGGHRRPVSRGTPGQAGSQSSHQGHAAWERWHGGGRPRDCLSIPRAKALPRSAPTWAGREHALHLMTREGTRLKNRQGHSPIHEVPGVPDKETEEVQGEEATPWQKEAGLQPQTPRPAPRAPKDPGTA